MVSSTLAPSQIAMPGGGAKVADVVALAAASINVGQATSAKGLELEYRMVFVYVEEAEGDDAMHLEQWGH